MRPCNKRFTNRVTLSVLEIRSSHLYTRPSQARVVEERSGFVVHSTDRVIVMINQQSWWKTFLRLQIAPDKRNSITVIGLSDIPQNELMTSGSICRQRVTLCIKKKSKKLVNRSVMKLLARAYPAHACSFSLVI